MLTGGLILHCYLDLASSFETNKFWKGRSRGIRGRDPLPLTEQEMERILRTEGNSFHGFILQMLHLSGKSRHQLFYPAFAAVCHGLSKMGMDQMAAYGFSTPHTSYTRLREDLYRNAEEKIRLLHLFLAPISGLLLKVCINAHILTIQTVH